MREIKFRAWDSEKKYFVDPIFYFIGLDGSAWFNLGGATEDKDNLIDQSDKLEIMQYTGLKDKNGKEIYEGDILDSKYKWEVIFADGCFWGNREDEGLQVLFGIIQKRIKAKIPIEIIGNIYENPELLTK